MVQILFELSCQVCASQHQGQYSKLQQAWQQTGSVVLLNSQTKFDHRQNSIVLIDCSGKSVTFKCGQDVSQRIGDSVRDRRQQHNDCVYKYKVGTIMFPVVKHILIFLLPKGFCMWVPFNIIQGQLMLINTVKYPLCQLVSGKKRMIAMCRWWDANFFLGK